MKKEPTDTLTLRLPISKKLRLEIIANKESRTLNSLCNKIIMDYLEDYVKEHKQNFKFWITIKKVYEILETVLLIFYIILFLRFRSFSQ